MTQEEKEIVRIKIDDWSDMGEAEPYLKEIEVGKHDNDVNYSCVLYDMANIYCITTTREYAEKHKLTDHIVKWSNGILDKYYPEYNPDKFGCMFLGLWGEDADNWADEDTETEEEEAMISVEKVKEWLLDTFFEYTREGDYDYGQPYLECSPCTMSELLDEFDKFCAGQATER